MKKTSTASKGSPRTTTLRNHFNRRAQLLTPRQRLVLSALMDGPHSRREIDLLTGGYNGPKVIHQLRGLGIVIECHMVLHTNKLGRRERRGVYRLARTCRQGPGGGK